MHDTAYEIGRIFFENYIGNNKCRILDLGSLDLNGSLRDFAPPEAEFIGADMVPGKSVDVVLDDPHKLPFEEGAFDFVVSSSCFEHDKFFWLSFLEICRVTKEGGFIYISSPSNGDYHTHPMDCWRFYPDSGHALAQWAARNNVKLTLIESFIGNRKDETWNDCVMVFQKKEIQEYSGRFISDIYCSITNLWKFPYEKVLNYEYRSEDSRIIQDQRLELASYKNEAASIQVAQDPEVAAAQTAHTRELFGIKSQYENQLAAAQSHIQDILEKHQSTLAELNDKLDHIHYQLDVQVPSPSSLQKFISKLLPASIRNALKNKKLEDDIFYLKNSNLFDPNWYLIHNPDVSAAGVDPASHYIHHGEIEGRHPAPYYKPRHHHPKAISYRKLALTGSYFVEYLKLLQKHRGYIDTVRAEQMSFASKVDLEELFEGTSLKRHEGPDKIDVLFIGHDASISGAPIILLELIEELIRNYPINPKIVLQNAGPLLENYKKLGPVIILDDLNRRTGSLDNSVGLISRSFVRQTGSKVVLANTAAVSINFCRQFRQLRVPFFSWIHELPDDIDRYFGGQEKMEYLSRNSTTLVFGGSLSYKENLSRFKLKKNNAKIIEWGIKLQKDDLERENLRSLIRKEFDIPTNAQLVLGCGTVEYRKGTDLFAQVVKIFTSSTRSNTSNVHFLWIGAPLSSKYLEDIKFDIMKAGLQNQVHFAGERKNSHPYFKASDAFLLTSRWDTRPLVALEAIGYKLPVVGFEDATGIAEYTSKGYGSMVPYLDTYAMAEELSLYLSKQKTIKDNGDKFIAEEITASRFAKMFFEEFKNATPTDGQKSGKSILVISAGCPPLSGHRAEGGGLRSWGLARSLKRLLPDHEVTLSYSYKLEDKIENGYYENIFVTECAPGALKDLVRNFSTVIVSYCMGGLSRDVSKCLDSHQQLILDCYVPIYVEICARKSESVQQEYDSLMQDIPYFNETLKRGDFFLCANKAQSSFYEGVLSALGRINPKTYHDTGLRIVPYGIDADEPVGKKQPIKKLLGGVSEKSWKILWFGAVYPWFNIKILIDAIQLLNEKHPTQMVMVGAKNPFVDHPDFIEKSKEVQALVSNPGIKDIIHTHDWVPFEDRADWYLDCNLIITLNEPGMENSLSWRTRVADYVWAGMPIASNGGDPLTEDLIAHGAAGRLDISTLENLSESIYKILADESGLKRMKSQMQAYRPNLYWDHVVKPLVEIIASRALAADRT